MLKPYVVSIEGPRGIAAITYEAANDVDAFAEAAEIVFERIEDLDPASAVEIMRPDATPFPRRSSAKAMARFARQRSTA